MSKPRAPEADAPAYHELPVGADAVAALCRARDLARQGAPNAASQEALETLLRKDTDNERG